MSADAQSLYAGTFERSMDAKKRVAVPSAWLEKKEGEELYSVPHPSGGYLMVMPPAELRLQEQRFMQSDRLNPQQKREAVRLFYAGAYRLTTDGQGRVLLPEDHCESAGLKGGVVLVGGRSRFEIWDKARFEAAAENAKDTYLQAAMEIGL
jgi:MraZ protein